MKKCDFNAKFGFKGDFNGDLAYKLKIAGSNKFSAQFIKIISHYIIKGLAITLMYCNRLHAWWSTQSWLATLLSSLIFTQVGRTSDSMTVPT